MTFGQRAAEHRKILTEQKYQPAVDGARSGDHAVTGYFLRLHAEIDAVMLDVHVDFLERTWVEQHVDAFACGQLALAVLRVDTLLSAAQPRRRTFVSHLFEYILHYISSSTDQTRWFS